MKKEELEKEVEKYKEKARIEESVADGLQKRDEKIRKEFAKAFDWVEPIDYYTKMTEYSTPSWEQIFVELGKLLRSDDFGKIRKEIDTFRSLVLNLEKRTREKDNA